MREQTTKTILICMKLCAAWFSWRWQMFFGRACDLSIASILLLTILMPLALAAPDTHIGSASSNSKETIAAVDKKPNPGKYNLLGHGGPVRSIHLADQPERALTGSFDYTMILWDLTVTPAKILKRFRDHGGPVNSVRFLHHKRQALSGSDDGKLRLFDLNSLTQLHLFSGHSSKIVQIAIDEQDAYAATASWDRTVRLWDLKKRREAAILKGHRGPINALAFVPGTNQILTGSYDGTIRLWNKQTGAFIRELYNHGWGINVLHVLGEGQQVLFGSQNGNVSIVNINTGKISKLLNPHEGPVLSLAHSKKHQLVATGGADGKIRVWNSSDWSLLEEYEVPQGPVWSIGFSHDGVGLYFTGLDDFAVYWHINPRAKFEKAQTRFPRRFQMQDNMSTGERQFVRKCSICHSLTSRDSGRAGPSLYGLFGRKAGTLKGYLYSKGLRRSNIIWNEKSIAQLFDIGPDRLTPGSKMPLQKILNPEYRSALIRFLKEATRPTTK